MDVTNLQITWQTLLAICAAVAIVAGGVKAVAPLFSPFRSLKTRLDDHERRLKKDYERLERLEAANKALVKGMLALLEHAATGNSVEKIKQAKTELQEYLIER